VGGVVVPTDQFDLMEEQIQSVNTFKNKTSKVIQTIQMEANAAHMVLMTERWI